MLLRGARREKDPLTHSEARTILNCCLLNGLQVDAISDTSGTNTQSPVLAGLRFCKTQLIDLACCGHCASKAAQVPADSNPSPGALPADKPAWQ